MKTLLKGLRHLLVTSLVLGLGLIFAPTARAQDWGLFFPFITTESGKFTFITILNDGGSDGTTATTLHYTYATKAVTAGAVNNKAGCDHFDGDGDTTPYDMMAFEVAGKVKTNPPSAALFGDTTSSPVTLFVTGRIGFLVVETFEENAVLSGTAGIVDTASGLSFTYSTAFLTAFSPTDTGGSNIAQVEGDSSGGGPVTHGHRHFAEWYPDNIVKTSWYVVPLSRRGAMTTPTGGTLRLALTASARLLGPGAFDLDEHFFSGARTTPIRCLGIITRSDFLQPNTVAATAGGGWTRTVGGTTTLAVTDPDDPGTGTTGQVYSTFFHIMYKIQSTSALGQPLTLIHRVANAAALLPPILDKGNFGDTP